MKEVWIVGDTWDNEFENIQVFSSKDDAIKAFKTLIDGEFSEEELSKNVIYAPYENTIEGEWVTFYIYCIKKEIK